VRNDGLYRASALTFTTLLAIVPLMSVSITILAAFPVFEKAAQPVQNFVFENFVPNTGKVVQTYLETFAQQASQLSLSGLLFLIVTAILMMNTIETAFNKIWRVPERRNGVSAFLLYWGVLSLAPLLMGASFAISSYFVSAKLFSGTVAAMGLSKTHMLDWTPFLLSFVTFTLLYVIVPFCRVRWWHGAIGAFVAACLLEAAKMGFGYYFKRFDTYEMVYGAFATIPIFFLWIYWVWVIVLLGGEIAHACSVDYQRRVGSALDPFTHALRWLNYLWEAQSIGQAVSLEKLISSDSENYQVMPDTLLQTLVTSQLVKSIGGNEFMLARDLNRMTLGELYSILPWRLPVREQIQSSENPVDQRFATIIEALEKQSHDLMVKPVSLLMNPT